MATTPAELMGGAINGRIRGKHARTTIETVQAEPCVHHWLTSPVESEEGRLVTEQCVKCDEKRSVLKSFEHQDWLGKDNNHALFVRTSYDEDDWETHERWLAELS